MANVCQYCRRSTYTVAGVCRSCQMKHRPTSGNDAAKRVEGERGRESDRQEAAAWHLECFVGTDEDSGLVGIYPRTPEGYAALNGLVADVPVRVKVIMQLSDGALPGIEAEKRDAQRSGVDEPESLTEKVAGTDRQIWDEADWVLGTTPTTPSTQETVLLERLKELVTAWKGKSLLQDECAKALEQVLRTATHPEKTTDES